MTRATGWLPFSTDDVRDQCAHFGDAPLAHPLPVKHLLMMCDAIDDLRERVNAATRPWPENAIPLCDCGGVPVHTAVRHQHWPPGTDFNPEGAL